jgi:aminoglycoside 3-N-acetyltransferase
MDKSDFITQRRLESDLHEIGLASADAVLVHASIRSVGRVLGGPDTIIDAIRAVLGPEGTLLAYTDWQLEEDALEIAELRDDIPPFDPERSRSCRDYGTWAELVRTVPGSRRSGNPGASMAAIGGRADWFTANHALDYGYGPDSPLGKLVAAKGKVLMLGAPLDTMTLLHHAEQIADFPNKRVISYEVPIVRDGGKVWQRFEEFDTSDAPQGLPEDYMAGLVEDFLATGHGRRGTVGNARSVLVRADEIVPFAVSWLERKLN